MISSILGVFFVNSLISNICVFFQILRKKIEEFTGGKNKNFQKFPNVLIKEKKKIVGKIVVNPNINKYIDY